MNIKIRGLDKLDQATKNAANFVLAVPKAIAGVLRKNFRQASSETRPQIPVRTGAVKRLFSFSVKGGTDRNANISGQIGFIRKPANQHEAVAPNVFEKGAIIVPKKGKFLWIPIGSNVDAAGHAKSRPFIVKTMVLRSRGGNLIAFRRLGPEEVGPPEPMFLLRQSVTIPARPIIAPMEQKMVPAIERDVEAEISKLSEKV